MLTSAPGAPESILADPELAAGPASDLNAAALAALGGSYQADDGYTALVRRALGRIADGGLDKVVTARELHIASGLEPIAVLNRLRSRYPSCVTFAFGRGRRRSSAPRPNNWCTATGCGCRPTRWRARGAVWATWHATGSLQPSCNTTPRS